MKKRRIVIIKKVIILLTAALVAFGCAAQTNNQQMDNIQELCTFIQEAGYYSLATVEGDQPHVRAFSSVAIIDGKLYITTSKSKNVFKHLDANGKFELLALKRDMTWVRVTGKLVSDDTAKERFLEQHPHLRNAYYRDSLDDMAVLYIAPLAKAVYTIKGQEHTVEL